MQSLTTQPATIVADKSIIKPSKQFTRAVYNSLNAITVFMLVYLLLFLAAVAFAIACGIAGVAIISLKVHWLTIALGLALIASGLLLVFFLIKFLFKRTEKADDNRYEIYAEDQPELFAFIQLLTQQTETSFPKHVYLSPEVNAYVFYDSSFWSMFFPVKKNLNIGMGLVNSLNQSEFKTVLAHEFGHFSQRSMKFGSYVYNLNKIIYNMLYDNEGYANMLNSWSSIHSFFQITSFINIKIIKGIQYILQKVYVYLNKSHLRLSREMEFHADAISAYVGGANNAITASRRLDIGQLCYNATLNYWNSQLQNKKMPGNIYPQHAEIIKHFAIENNISVDRTGLPVAGKQIAALNNQQVIIADQWASHPSSEDREAALEKIPVIEPEITEPAWELFRDAEKLQGIFTGSLYDEIDTTSFDMVDFHSFKETYYKEAEANTYNNTYKGYYNARAVYPFDVNEAIVEANANPVKSFGDLFTDENSNMPRALAAMQTDIDTIDNILDKKVDSDIKTFDFRGVKYGFADAEDVKNILVSSQEETRQKITTLDKDLFISFYKHAYNTDAKEKLANYYRLLFSWQQQDDEDYEIYKALMVAFNPVYITMSFDNIELTLKQVYELEPAFKERLRAMLLDETYKPHISAEWQKSIDKYLSQNWTYFIHPDYDNDAITAFSEVISAYAALVAERVFHLKKEIFDYQLTLIL